MLYIFDGDNAFVQHEEVTALKATLGPADMLSLNTSVFDGARVGFDELRHACDSMPFLTEARLVIVNGLLTRLQGSARKRPESPDDKGEDEGEDESKNSSQKAYRNRLLDYLPALPATTHLVLLEPAMLTAGNPFLRLQAAHSATTKRKALMLPNLRRPEGRADLEKWITTRAKAKGASIDRKAVAELVALIGNDLQQIDSELEKLAVYCQGQPISAGDVKELVSLAREAVIWDLVDSIAQRNLKGAMDTLRRLLNEGEPPLRIFGLIVREYRILLQIKDMDDRRSSEDLILARLGLQPWMLRQRAGAIAATSVERLKSIYRMLLDIDVEIKTGIQDPEAALEFLVAKLCQL